MIPPSETHEQGEQRPETESHPSDENYEKLIREFDEAIREAQANGRDEEVAVLKWVRDLRFSSDVPREVRRAWKLQYLRDPNPKSLQAALEIISTVGNISAVKNLHDFHVQSEAELERRRIEEARIGNILYRLQWGGALVAIVALVLSVASTYFAYRSLVVAEQQMQSQSDGSAVATGPLSRP